MDISNITTQAEAAITAGELAFSATVTSAGSTGEVAAAVLAAGFESVQMVVVPNASHVVLLFTRAAAA